MPYWDASDLRTLPRADSSSHRVDGGGGRDGGGDVGGGVHGAGDGFSLPGRRISDLSFADFGSLQRADSMSTPNAHGGRAHMVGWCRLTLSNLHRKQPELND